MGRNFTQTQPSDHLSRVMLGSSFDLILAINQEEFSGANRAQLTFANGGKKKKWLQGLNTQNYCSISLGR